MNLLRKLSVCFVHLMVECFCLSSEPPMPTHTDIHVWWSSAVFCPVLLQSQKNIWWRLFGKRHEYHVIPVELQMRDAYFCHNCGLLLLGGRGCGAVLSAVERVFFAGDGAGFLMMRMGDFCDDLGGIAGSRSTNVRATKKVRPHCPTQFELAGFRREHWPFAACLSETRCL